MRLSVHRFSLTNLFVLTLFLIAIPLSDISSQDVLILKEERIEVPQTGRVGGENSQEEGLSPQQFVVFYRMWRDFEEAFQAGEMTQADDILSGLVALRERNDIPRLTGFAAAVVQRGDDEVKTNRSQHALNLYRLASALDPALSAAYYRQSELYARQGIGGWIRAASTAMEGFLAPRLSATGRYYFNARLTIVLLAALFLAGICFSATLLIRYLPLLKHDLSEKFSSSHSSVINIVLALLLLLPLLLLIGPFWLAPFWLMLFAVYGTKSEKVVTVCFLLVFAASYPVYRRVIQTAEAISDPKVRVYVETFSSGATPRNIQNFQKYHLEHPEDKDASIMLAYLYKVDQKYTAAMQLLQQQILAHPSDERAYNNLANVYFLLGETDTALRLSQKAVSLSRQCAICRYNLAKLQRAKFNFREADRLMHEARALDPELVRRLEESPHQRLVDSIPSSELTESRVAAASGSLKSSLANPFTLYSFSMLILASFITMLRTRHGFARQCTKCGHPFCKDCQTSKKDFRFCIQCLHIYVKKDGVSPISRKEKMLEIDRFSQRERRFSTLSSLLVPGVGSIYRKRTIFGSVVLVFWTFLLVFALTSQWFARYSIDPETFSRTLTVLSLLLMVFVYLIANLPRFKRT